ncbi:MAG TPA: diguanylate cyclase [Rectinemataceae bacterium]|nr:diguanylate cyclase [Rectinemataceae bacterium]
MLHEASNDDTSKLLRRAELFSSLLDDDLSYVEERCETFALEAGARLFSPGEKARRFFIVRSGEIGVYRPEEGGKEREIARYMAGDVLGDFDFAVGASFDAHARALTEARLIAFPSRGVGLEELAREKPDTTARILLRSLSMISSRLRSTQRLISENAPWVRELRRQVYTDPGTGLWSRAFLDEEIPRMIEPPTAIVLVKPDRFKELNDAHGHGAGDEAMELVAGLLAAETERHGKGWALRLRSNETALVLPRSSFDEAASAARRLAAGIGGLEPPSAAGSGFRFTASAAVALWPDNCPEWKRLVEDAYGVLTKAWRDGGNRIYRVRRRDQEPRP